VLRHSTYSRVIGRRLAAIALIFAAWAGARTWAQGLDSIALPSVAIDGPQLLADLKALSADDMEGRRAGTAAGARARAYIIERFKTSGIQPFASGYARAFPLGESSGEGRSAREGVNVIGHIPGTTRSAQYIVISAHYDHLGTNGGQVFNGANDNASGTAALFALGKYFSRNPPRHGLIFAAFDAEEVNLNGSRAFVRAPPVARSAIVLNLNADMIGRDANNRLYVSGTFEQPALKPPVMRVAGRAPVDLRTGYDNPRGGSDYWMRSSDQWAFREAGVPALYVGVEDFEQHHKPSDDYGTMTLVFFVNAVETMRMLVEEFDRSL
jgi:hypothetical protein